MPKKGGNVDRTETQMVFLPSGVMADYRIDKHGDQESVYITLHPFVLPTSQDIDTMVEQVFDQMIPRLKQRGDFANTFLKGVVVQLPKENVDVYAGQFRVRLSGPDPSIFG